MSDAANDRARRLLSEAARDLRRPLALAALATVVQTLAAVAFAWETAVALDAAILRGAELAALVPTLVTMTALAALRAASGYAADRLGFAAAAMARRDLFARALDHVVALGPVRLADHPTGDLVSTLTDALDALDPYFRRWTTTLAAATAAPVAILALAVPMDWRSGLVFLGAAPLFLLAMVLVGRGAETAANAQWATLARLSGHLLDTVQGLRDLALFGAAKRQIDVVARMADAYRRETMKVLRIAFLSALALEFFATVSIALVSILVGFRLLDAAMSFRTGLFMLLLAPLFYAPLRVLGAERHAKMEATAAAERIVALLERPSSPTAGAPFDPRAATALRFEGVSLRYGERVALDAVSFEIAAGEHVALVGPSGAGKSSILALLMGFVQPSGGVIRADGVDLATLDVGAWRRAVSYAPQRAQIFAATVAENVALGREGDLDAALARAGAAGFVAALPRQSETSLGENGATLSGGQAQRLSLARALLTPAPLLLVDEPTAHLDAATQASVAATLNEAARGRTMIVIAHRLETIRAADRIIVLDRGRVAEQGDHETLLAKGGLYASLVASGEM